MIRHIESRSPTTTPNANVSIGQNFGACGRLISRALPKMGSGELGDFAKLRA